jgi:hypothetical protein
MADNSSPWAGWSWATFASDLGSVGQAIGDTIYSATYGAPSPHEQQTIAARVNTSFTNPPTDTAALIRDYVNKYSPPQTPGSGLLDAFTPDLPNVDWLKVLLIGALIIVLIIIFAKVL